MATISRVGTAEVRIRVLISQARRAVDPADWLAVAWEMAGGEILERREILTPSGTTVELLVREVTQGPPRIWRTALYQDGDWFFRVDAGTEEPAFASLGEVLLLPVASFRLLRPEGQGTADSPVEFQHNRPVRFRLLRPASWEVTTAFSEVDQCVLHLASYHEGAEIGRITVDVRTPRSGRTLQRLAEEYADRLRESGARFGGGALHAVSPPPGFHAARLYAPPVRFEERELDFPVLLLEHPDALAVLSLLGPARKESPEWWAVNKRAFEIARDSLRIGDSA